MYTITFGLLIIIAGVVFWKSSKKWVALIPLLAAAIFGLCHMSKLFVDLFSFL